MMRSPISLALLVVAACGTTGRTSETPPPAPPAVRPAPPVWTISVPHPPLSICVVRNGALTRVTGHYATTTGDTMVDGRPFSQAHPVTEGYAAEAPWFIANEPLVLDGARYAKYGVPRLLGENELVRAGDYRGVPLFAEPPGGDRPPVVYVPVRPGCVFQPYQDLLEMRGVRG